METNEEDIVIVTPAMVEAARAELLAMIAEGRWPAPYEGDDQAFDDDDLPPLPAGELKAAE